MGKWESERLGSLTQVKGGKRIPKGCSYSNIKTSHPYLRVVDFENHSINPDNIQYIDESTASIISRYIISTEDIYISIAGTIGLVGIVPDKFNNANLTENAAKLVIKNNMDLDKKYLVAYLDSPFGQKQILSKTMNTSQPKLALFRIEEIQIPLPPLPIQQKIADVLDRAAALIEKRKAQIEKLDLLVKSQFIEMFDSSEIFANVSLIDVILEGAGLSYGIVQPGDDGTGTLGVLRPVDIINGEIRNSDIKYIDEGIAKGFSKTALNGDELLLTVRGTTGETALTTAYHKGMNVTRGIAVIRYDKSLINPKFLVAQIKGGKCQKFIAEHTRGATLQQINLSDLRVMSIFLPSLTLQNEFADIVSRVEKQKSLLQSSLAKMELNYKSLMQKCFKGEDFIG